MFTHRLPSTPRLRRAGAWAFAFFLAKGLAWLALAVGIGYVHT
jgi:hypothetical protein